MSKKTNLIQYALWLTNHKSDGQLTIRMKNGFQIVCEFKKDHKDCLYFFPSEDGRMAIRIYKDCPEHRNFVIYAFEESDIECVSFDGMRVD